MAEFINFEAEAEDVELESDKEDDEVSNISESSFIDDQEVGTDVNFYRHFANVENDLDQVLRDSHNEALEDIEQFDEISYLCDGSDGEIEIEEFKNVEIDITKFKETLFPRVDQEQEKVENQFCKTILYALRFDKNGMKDVCSKDVLKKRLIKVPFNKLIKLKNSNLLLNYKNLLICVMKLISFCRSLSIVSEFLN